MKKKQKAKGNMLKTLCMAAVMVFGTVFFTSTVYAAKGDVKIDSNHFPDELFRQKISSDYDKNKDGILSKKELQAVKKIEMNDGNGGELTLKTTKGIEYFSNLQDLIIYHDFGKSNFQNLDISKNKKLKYVDVELSLKKLDVSKNPELSTGNSEDELSCDDNVVIIK